MPTQAPQPDVTLLLDMDGVIQEATLSPALTGESVDAWLGKTWGDIVGDHGDKIERMVSDAKRSGISAFRQITQRFPSGAELPMEFTTVLLGGRAGMLAIGKSLQAVAELQTRLISAQQTIERDYWKLREAETRYRLVIEDSKEAVLLVRVADLRIVEANRSASLALAATLRRKDGIVGRDFLQDVANRDRDAVDGMLRRVRDQGKAPGILIHLGPEATSWVLRGSLTMSEAAPAFLLQMSPVSGLNVTAHATRDELDELLDRLPDAVVVIDDAGALKRVNRAFVDLAEIGSKDAALGQKLSRWLSRPGADLSVLISNVVRHGSVKLLSHTLVSGLGSETEIEISATGFDVDGRKQIVLIIRNVARRLSSAGDGDSLRVALSALSETVGKTPLRKLVKSTVEVVEQHYVRAALSLADGNRTSAAEILGLSRQSLYAKLDRYGLSDRGDRGEET